MATGNHPDRDQGPKESIIWKPLQIDSTADEYKYVIWKERFLNQLSRVKVDAIPLNYVLCSEEDLRRLGVTTAPADPTRSKMSPMILNASRFALFVMTMYS